MNFSISISAQKLHVDYLSVRNLQVQNIRKSRVPIHKTWSEKVLSMNRRTRIHCAVILYFIRYFDFLISHNI